MTSMNAFGALHNFEMEAGWEKHKNWQKETQEINVKRSSSERLLQYVQDVIMCDTIGGERDNERVGESGGK